MTVVAAVVVEVVTVIVVIGNSTLQTNCALCSPDRGNDLDYHDQRDMLEVYRDRHNDKEGQRPRGRRSKGEL